MVSEIPLIAVIIEFTPPMIPLIKPMTPFAIPLKMDTTPVPNSPAFSFTRSQLLYMRTPAATTRPIAATIANMGRFSAVIAPASVKVPVALAAQTTL